MPRTTVQHKCCPSFSKPRRGCGRFRRRPLSLVRNGALVSEALRYSRRRELSPTLSRVRDGALESEALSYSRMRPYTNVTSPRRRSFSTETLSSSRRSSRSWPSSAAAGAAEAGAVVACMTFLRCQQCTCTSKARQLSAWMPRALSS